MLNNKFIAVKQPYKLVQTNKHPKKLAYNKYKVSNKIIT